MPESESSTSAVLEQAAEVTAEKSPLSPETSQSQKDGVKPGETPPAKDKSSQETPSPDASKDDEEPANGIVNIHAHRRIKTERNELRTKLNEFAELGFKSKADLETHLQEAETATTEARKQGFADATDWIVKQPEGFAKEILEQFPDAAPKVLHAFAPDVLLGVAQWVRRTDPELAGKLEELAGKFEGTESGRRAPESSEKSAPQDEATGIRAQGLFDREVAEQVNGPLRSNVQELTKGLLFNGDKHKAKFVKDVMERIRIALDRNVVFSERWNRIANVRNLDPAQMDRRVAESVSLHLKHADEPLLKRLIEEEREESGIGLMGKPPSKNGDRTEVIAGGAVPKGQGLTRDAKDKKYAELRESLGSSQRADEAYAVWLYEQRA